MIDVALCPSEIRRLSATDLSGITAIVFDVLRATSSIITGLAFGAELIIPVSTLEEAHALKLKDPGLLLAGERGGLPPSGFDLGNSPQEFQNVRGRRVVMTTTNGTIAIQSMKTAGKVLIGSLLNLDALSGYLFMHRPGNLLLVCAGTEEEFSLEDAAAAGALVSRLSDGGDLSDSAIMTRSLYKEIGHDLESWLRQTKNGRKLREIGKEADILWCSRVSVFDQIGQFKEGKILRSISEPGGNS